MSGLTVRILGSAQVFDGERRVPLGSPAQRRVFLALLLAEGHSLSLDRLIDISWRDHPPASAVNLVHGYISGLRKALEPDRRPRDPGSLLQGGSGGYRLVVDRMSIDAARFERLLDEVTPRLETDPVAALELLDQALGMWNGAALADVAGEEFARGEAARLEELRVGALEQRFEAALASGRTTPALAELEAFAAEHPLRERTTGLLMTALYRAGRQADAMRAFGVTARALRDELGLAPSPELQAIELSVLQQHPGLAAPLPRRENLPVPRCCDPTARCSRFAAEATRGIRPGVARG